MYYIYIYIQSYSIHVIYIYMYVCVCLDAPTTPVFEVRRGLNFKAKSGWSLGHPAAQIRA